ncbi:copper homeostasis protein CutC [Galbibacter orientalis]|uniref:copper homeostasis protein CutC n=1 Tax=Galbibacter orientalis TaxID=453852 RepID=UPI0030809083
MIIEICANSVESALNAEEGGANRIEFCGELSVGGITPSYGMLVRAVEQLSIPVFVLIRPRSGNFTYSDEEFEVMKEDVLFCKKIGCSGIVSGVLDADNNLDIDRTRELVELSKPLEFTFHRAFDWVSQPEEAFKQLIEIGCKRVLTSGQAEKAIDGLSLLKKLKSKYGDSIVIMPGSGVNIDNVLEFRKDGFSEIHFSASSAYKNLTATPKISFNGNASDESFITKSDLTLIKQMVDKVK